MGGISDSHFLDHNTIKHLINIGIKSIDIAAEYLYSRILFTFCSIKRNRNQTNSLFRKVLFFISLGHCLQYFVRLRASDFLRAALKSVLLVRSFSFFLLFWFGEGSLLLSFQCRPSSAIQVFHSARMTRNRILRRNPSHITHAWSVWTTYLIAVNEPDTSNGTMRNTG